MANGNGNNTTYPEISQDPTFVPGWVPRATLVPGQVLRAQPAVPTQPNATWQSLASARQPFIQELQNPAIRQRFIASIAAEVGDQSAAAQQAYAESVMNRAAAGNRSIWDTVNDSGYYPKKTMDQLGRTFSPDQAASFNAVIDKALGGSNTSNVATGNQSPPVKSGGAPILWDGKAHGGGPADCRLCH